MVCSNQPINKLSNELINYSIKLPRDLWLKAKIKALRENKKLSEVIRDLLRKWVEDEVLEIETQNNIKLTEIPQVSSPESRSDKPKLPEFLQDNPWLDVLKNRR